MTFHPHCDVEFELWQDIVTILTTISGASLAHWVDAFFPPALSPSFPFNCSLRAVLITY